MSFCILKDTLKNKLLNCLLCFITPLCIKAIVELQSEKYVQTIDEGAVLELEHNDKSLYVFSDFTSDAFEHCRKVCFSITFSPLYSQTYGLISLSLNKCSTSWYSWYNGSAPLSQWSIFDQVPSPVTYTTLTHTVTRSNSETRDHWFSLLTDDLRWHEWPQLLVTF